ncbi:MAG TPA: PEGA domain-containing protein [Polyangia bacterium]
MPRYSTLLAALVVLFMASIAQAADVSVAVLGLEPVDVPEPLAQQLTDALRQRVSATSGVRMVQGKDLIEVKMVFGCDGELPACMAQAGKTLGTDKLLYGTVKKGGGKNTVTVALKLLDVKTAVVEKFVNDTVQKRELAGSNVNGVAARWFGQLLEIEAKPTLTVTSDPSGAGVSVDGQSYGRTPLTLRDLTAGAHSVTVSMPGRQPFTRNVELRAGGSHDVVATLEPEAAPVVAHKEPVKPAPEPLPLVTPTPTPPPLRAEHPGRTAKIVAGVLVGAAVVTAAVAIYTWRTYSDLEATAHSDLDALKPNPVPAQDAPFFMSPSCNVPTDLAGSAAATKFHNDCTSGNNYANATTGLWVATGALAAAGVVSFVIGDRQAAKAKEHNVGVLRQTLRIAPVFSTRGGGLTAAFEF